MSDRRFGVIGPISASTSLIDRTETIASLISAIVIARSEESNVPITADFVSTLLRITEWGGTNRRVRKISPSGAGA